MNSKHRDHAFTLIELCIALGTAAIVVGIVYALMSEALTSYCRNYSVNKAYTDARLALDRLAVSVQSAGHMPILVDATGGPVNTTPAEGIRYYRYGAFPRYTISGILTPTQTTIPITVGAGQPVPAVGNIITIAPIGLQAYVTNVALAGSTATVTCSNTSSTGLPTSISANCPTPPSPAAIAAAKTVLLFTQVAAIVAKDTRNVPQLRFYPRAMSVAKDGAAAFNDSRNYYVMATLLPNPVTPQQSKPFQIEQSSLVRATICALAPDYVNLGSMSGNVVYSVATTSLASRCPKTLIRPPY